MELQREVFVSLRLTPLHLYLVADTLRSSARASLLSFGRPLADVMRATGEYSTHFDLIEVGDSVGAVREVVMQTRVATDLDSPPLRYHCIALFLPLTHFRFASHGTV